MDFNFVVTMVFVLATILLFGLYMRERNQRVALEKRIDRIWSTSFKMWQMLCSDKKLTLEEIIKLLDKKEEPIKESE